MPKPEYTDNNTYLNPNLDNECVINLAPTSGSFMPMAYVIYQPFVGILPYAQALQKGTIFPNILFPEIK